MDTQPAFAPAHATFYGNFEDKYGSETARPNPLTGQSQAVPGMTIAVDPKLIPYGSRVYVPEMKQYSANGDGVFIAHDTGADVVKRTASNGTSPVIDFYSNATNGKQLDGLNDKFGTAINYRILGDGEQPPANPFAPQVQQPTQSLVTNNPYKPNPFAPMVALGQALIKKSSGLS